MIKRYITILIGIFFSFTLNNLAQNTHHNLGDASQFNLFTIGNADLSSADIQGRVAIGSNAHFTTYSIGDQIPNSQGTVNILTVGDSLWYSGGRVYSGNVVYGEFADVSDNLILDGEGTVFQGTPVDFAAVGIEVADISIQWGGIPANGSTSIDNNILTLTGANNGLNVFLVSADTLQSVNGVTINSPEGSTVVVNVSGSNITWQGDNDVTGTNQTNVVYNFYEADTLTISGIAVKGSILAPFAQIFFTSGQINGNVICHDITGEGQINYSYFNGNVEYSSSEVTSSCTVTMKRVLKGQSFRLSETFDGHHSFWAGTILGQMNSHATSYYCIDISHYLKWNRPYEYDGAITGPVAYILRNYYPHVPYTGDNGQLNRERKEAAAVQAAIWHFSDGFDASTISNNNQIKNRALEIIDAATNQNPVPITTFTVQPASQVVQVGQTAMLTVVLRDSEGNPVPNAFVTLNTTAGTLVPEEGTTDANGQIIVALQYDDVTNPESAEITVATDDGIIPEGTRYIYPNSQTLVTNDELVTCLTTVANVYWSNSALPGNDFDFYMFTTTNSGLPANGLTSVAAMNDYVYFGTNSGFYAYDRANDTFEQITLTNNNIGDIYALNDNTGNRDIYVGFTSGGFAYKHGDADFVYYNASNGFNGSHVYDFEFYNYNGSKLMLIAHDAGVSLFNPSTGVFANITSTNSDLLPGTCYDATIDDNGGIWVGTDYGVSFSTDFGTTWTTFTTQNSGITGNFVRSIAYGNGEVYVGTFYSGLCGFDIDSGAWTNYTPFISTQPVMNLHFADGKLFIANWSEGLYVYSDGNFKQYSSVNPNNAPTIIEDFWYDGTDFWFAVQSGLSRTIDGITASTGDAAIVIGDNSTYAGGTTTLDCNLVPAGDIEFHSLTGTIEYNAGELEFIDYTVQELFAGCIFHFNETSPGRIQYKAICPEASPVTTEGTMFSLTFKVKEEMAPLGGGIIAVFAPSFTAGVNNPLNHEDLGVISWSNDGSGNAGEGDANLDAGVDLSDFLATVDHYTFGGQFALSGDGFNNADVDENETVDADDASQILSFLTNGCFPGVFGGNQPAGGFIPAAVTLNPDNNEAAITLNTEDVENLNNMTITFTFDTTQINYEAFSSIQIGNGNYVHATNSEPGKVIFTFNAPTFLSGNFELGDIVIHYNDTKGDILINTTYSYDGINQIPGPVITFNPNGVQDEAKPTSFKLEQNYPNPFNPSTTIRFSLPRHEFVSLKIYDILGQEVKTLLSGEKNVGTYSVKWNGDDNCGNKISSGVYFYRIKAGNYINVKKMVLLK